MTTMTVKEALALVLDEMDALSPDELRADLLLHSGGPISTALKEAQAFLYPNIEPEKSELN